MAKKKKPSNLTSHRNESDSMSIDCSCEETSSKDCPEHKSWLDESMKRIEAHKKIIEKAAKAVIKDYNKKYVKKH